MAWGNFLLIITIVYPIYYGLNFLIDITKSPKTAESEEETYTFDDIEEETFLMDDDEDEKTLEVSPSSPISTKPLFEVEKINDNTAKPEAETSEIINQPFKDFHSIQDQGIPVLEFRSKAKDLASSFKF